MYFACWRWSWRTWLKGDWTFPLGSLYCHMNPSCIIAYPRMDQVWLLTIFPFFKSPVNCQVWLWCISLSPLAHYYEWILHPFNRTSSKPLIFGSKLMISFVFVFATLPIGFTFAMCYPTLTQCSQRNLSKITSFLGIKGLILILSSFNKPDIRKHNIHWFPNPTRLSF